MYTCIHIIVYTDIRIYVYALGTKIDGALPPGLPDPDPEKHIIRKKNLI